MEINRPTGYILLHSPGEYVIIRHAVELGLAVDRNNLHPSFGDQDVDALREQLDIMPIAISPRQRILPVGITPLMAEVAVTGLKRTHPLEEPHAREYRAHVARRLEHLLRTQR
jgi:hypothetical protein